ncbi:MAG TPA: mechanosensitive ion channel domain-containing protein [Jatrophihabitantaceae bacterium]
MSAVTRLPEYLHEHSKVLIQTPIRILLIIIVAVLLRAILHRFINRMTRPVQGGSLPRLLRPLREKVDTTAILESAGLLSERRTQRAATVASVLRSFVSFTIFVLTALMILGELDIDLLPLVAGTSIVGVALGFGAQNIVKDFLAGMFMMLEDQYGVGDVIDFEQATGTVEAVGLRTTRLRDINGTVWYVRNGEVVRVGNKSQGYAQVVLDVPIAASVDIDAASAALREVADEMHAEDDWASVFIGEPDVQGVESITRYETVLRLVVRVRPLEQWRTARELRRRIRDRLERLDIEAGEPQEPPS